MLRQVSGRPGHFSLVGLLAGALAGIITEDLGLASLVSFWGDAGPFIAAGAIVGSLIWNTRLQTVVAAVTTTLLVLWASVSFTPLSAWMAKDLPRRDSIAPADAIFVASSDIQLDGELTSIAMSRIVHAIELLAEGHAPALVVSNLPAPYPAYTTEVRALLDHLHVAGQFVTVGPVRNSHEEALAVAALYHQRGWKRVILVTSPYHSRRAAGSLEHEGVETISSPSVETVFDAETLERSGERRRAFGRLIHEELGLWVYRRRGWLGRSDRGE